jgi:hypothetical protein
VHLEAALAGSVQPAQRRLVSHVPVTLARLLRLPGAALTALEGDHVLMTGGLMPTGDQMAVLWAVLADDAGAHMVRLDKAVRRFLAIHERYRRLEASVQQDFPEGCRWLELLGFEREGPLRAYGDDGADHWRYARVRR